MRLREYEKRGGGGREQAHITAMVPTEAANQKKCVPSRKRCTLLLLILLLLDLGDEGRMQPWGGCATRQETLRAGWWAWWAGEDGAGHKTTAEV